MSEECVVPWQASTVAAQRLEFVLLAEGGGVSFQRLCDRFGISPKTGYKWLGRYREEGQEGLVDRSRRPVRSPARTDPRMEQLVCEVRRAHKTWGGRTIRAVLLKQGHQKVPAPSTITGILRRNGLVEDPVRPQRDLVRFEWAEPNQMWQMDFKGDFGTDDGARCYPLTVIDDHSRYNLCLGACPNQQRVTVVDRLKDVFGRYGLPERMLMDNGSPWGYSSQHPHTRFTTWLVDLGIRVIHSRPMHPQTLGKDERFHRTMGDEVLQGRRWESLIEVQHAFDQWRPVYNQQRPHQALDYAVPADRYQPSPRSYPTVIEPWEYRPDDQIRKVSSPGARINFQGQVIKIGKAFSGRYVAVRTTPTDALYDIYYRHQHIKQIDLQQ